MTEVAKSPLVKPEWAIRYPELTEWGIEVLTRYYREQMSGKVRP